MLRYFIEFKIPQSYYGRPATPATVEELATQFKIKAKLLGFGRSPGTSQYHGPSTVMFEFTNITEQEFTYHLLRLGEHVNQSKICSSYPERTATGFEFK